MENLHYLNSAQKTFEYYKELGDKCFEQLREEQFFQKPTVESNSVATIVKHLWGNMLSRWTDFLTTDGEKEWRMRDKEFENDLTSKKEVLEKWEAGWSCLFMALGSMTETDLSKTVLIRSQSLTVIEAINRQLAHYAYHVGQIVYIGKMMLDREWTSLSIPKGASRTYKPENK
ncbi:MAG: DUF1572 family protein [Bacteroidota bacterium]